MDDNKELIAQCEAKAKLWLAPAFDEETRKSVQSMLDNEDKTDLIESFYKDLEFGCILYSSDAADALIGVDLGGRLIIK